MNIYEIVFSGTKDHRDDDSDTIFLVRASDFRTAMEEVILNRAGVLPSNNQKKLLPRVVHEMGIDLSAHSDDSSRILRGPYFQCAYNYGWKSWERKTKDGSYTDEWEEKKYY
jgi:hypothetical protein